MLVTQLRAAKRASVPIVSVNTRDPAATMRSIVDGINGDSAKVAWSITSGLYPLDEAGRDVIGGLGNDALEDSRDLPQALRAAKDLPPGTILFVQQADQFINDALVTQSVWDLRDLFKQDHRMLVLLGRNVKLPTALQDDVLTFTESLPKREQVAQIVKQNVDDLNDARQEHELSPVPVTDGDIDRAADAVQGLSAYAVEQLSALCLGEEGFDYDALWER